MREIPRERIRSESDEPSRLLALGRGALLAGELAAAEHAFVALGRADPDSWHSLHHLGQTRLAMGRVSAAKRDLGAALDRFPGYPEAEMAERLLQQIRMQQMMRGEELRPRSPEPGQPAGGFR